MEENKELRLLKEICKENLNEYRLIKELLEKQKTKSLMNKRRGLNDEIETIVNSYIKRKKL